MNFQDMKFLSISMKSFQKISKFDLIQIDGPTLFQRLNSKASMTYFMFVLERPLQKTKGTVLYVK